MYAGCGFAPTKHPPPSAVAVEFRSGLPLADPRRVHSRGRDRADRQPGGHIPRSTLRRLAIQSRRKAKKPPPSDLAVTANTYSHVMLDEGEVDYAALLV